jgi:5-methylcytosine-specific restriction endonuclease McrA
MDFDEPHGRPESATIEHLIDSTLGGVRSQKHRRLAHAACNHARNEFRMQAERQFQHWIAERQVSEKTLTDK